MVVITEGCKAESGHRCHPLVSPGRFCDQSCRGQERVAKSRAGLKFQLCHLLATHHRRIAVSFSVLVSSSVG